MSADRRLKTAFFVVVLLAVFGFGGWYAFLREDVGAIDVAQDRIVEERVAQDSENAARDEAASEVVSEAPTAEPDPIVEPAPVVAQEPVMEPAPLGEVEPRIVEQMPADAVAEPDVAVAEHQLAEPRLVEPEAVAAEAAAAEVAETEPAVTEPEIVEEPAAQAPAESVEPPAADPVLARAPVFDIVRVEPTGEAVIAGRSFAGAVVELVRNGMVFDRMIADASGNFVFIPQDFPVGASEVVLRVVGADGAVLRSEQSVTIVVADDRQTTPMVAIVAPNQPTVVLSQPEERSTVAEVAAPVAREGAVADAPAAADASEAEDAISSDRQQVAAADAGAQADAGRTIRIASVEAETGGGLFVTGEAGPQAMVRLYLNDTFIAPAEAAADGTVSFAIERGVRSGSYRVRLDEVAGEAGTVLSRAEIVFVVPDLIAALPEAAPEVAPEAAPTVAAEPEAAADMAAAPEPVETPVADAQPAAEPDVPPAVEAVADAPARAATRTIPEISTAVVTRGDSLWRISREVYGSGIRYTEIFAANQNQIRNPDLIFPGQLFVLPPDPARQNAAEDAAEEEPQAN